MKRVVFVSLPLLSCSLCYSEPTKSGEKWCSLFPANNTVSGLSSTFRPKARDFLDAMREGGATVRIESAYRPEQRQYLMHWSWRISKEAYFLETTAPCWSIRFDDPSVGWYPPSVPKYTGETKGACEILWNWKGAQMDISNIRNCTNRCHIHFNWLGEAHDAAKAMATGYALASRPASSSNHTSGTAIDLTISWTNNLVLADKNGRTITISSEPKNGNNTDLHSVGATYGVLKLGSSKNHWSEDGH